jgi:hypothetical protein
MTPHLLLGLTAVAIPAIAGGLAVFDRHPRTRLVAAA